MIVIKKGDFKHIVSQIDELRRDIDGQKASATTVGVLTAKYFARLYTLMAQKGLPYVSHIRGPLSEAFLVGGCNNAKI